MTNINITSNDKVFTYVVDYVRNNNVHNRQYNYITSNGNILFQSDLIRDNNEWEYYEETSFIQTPILNTSATIRLYFPQFSVETYNEYASYVLDIGMFISDKFLSLGSFLVDRYNTLAAPKPIKFQGEEYCECIDFEIVDPYDILYSDVFEDFRKSIKGLSVDNEDNSDGTSLYISLHPVELNNGRYIIDNEYSGGQNSINISDNENDYLNYCIDFDEKENYIVSELKFNPVYKNDLKLYLKETYGWDGDYKIKYILALDKVSQSFIEYECQEFHHTFSLNELFDNINCLVPVDDERYKMKKFFNDWKFWEEGINIISTAIIYSGEIDRIKLKSNKIPLTQDLYSKIKIKEQVKINLDDMIVNDINIINSINIESAKYNTPENSKSNIILPVFYRVRDLGNVVIHPETNENICINLDAYKSKVDTFIMQIEGVKFTEMGTTNAGTIFKIIGGSLPKTKNNGTYYILSQDGDLVTTGKYTYEY